MTAEAVLAELSILTGLRAGLTSEPGIASRLGARRQLEARYGRVTREAQRLGLIGMPSKKKWRTL